MRCSLLATIGLILEIAVSQAQTTVWERRAVSTREVNLATVAAGQTYSLQVSYPAAVSRPVAVIVRQNGVEAVRKTLHAGDWDLFTFLRGGAPATLEFDGEEKSHPNVRLCVWPAGAPIEAEPNNRWQDANPIALGSTIFGSGDEMPYLPAGGFRESVENPQADWFKFEFRESSPKLVHFVLDLMERDNIPVDVSVHRVNDGKLVEFTNGEDPVTFPHEVQALPGNKFTTRVLTQPGTYYVRVIANHPEYKLRTRVYDPPPYKDPQRAVQPAIDYLIAAGDSWHANTPRRGGVFNRIASVHQETSLCVACHATHFPQRAQLYALRQGYAVNYRQQLQFLAERFYNNPRPFYGFEEQGAVWARVISAPANVLGRMSHLLRLYESEVTGEKRQAYHDGVGQYLKLYYKDRAKLPPDETNGNTPLVSTYEVAWYAWENTHDPKIAALVEQDDVKNTIDLCYQTLALAAIDKVKYADKLRANADRLLALQRPSGQWSAQFAPAAHDVEFQTGHALWALQAAGVPRDNPQVAKAVGYLLSRQQVFGGWLDPLQSFENFRTPFRETQMAVLALSAYYPIGTREPGWHSPKIDAGSLTIEQLDQVWDRPSPAVVAAIEKASASPDALMRQQAVEALGRLALPASLPLLTDRLSDPSKLVARTAAWSVRQIYSRHPEADSKPLLSALQSKSERARWGATRIFATHFAALAKRPEFAAPLVALISDPSPAIQTQAIKGAWQFWFWSPDAAAKSRIEDGVLAALAKPQHAWVERNLKEAIYNLADENIRYLYNNWIPLLGDPADRQRAIRGRLAIESRLASKFATVLETGNNQQKKWLLAGFASYELRRGDVYDVKADLSMVAPPVYNRIGNDVEQIVFFGDANDRFAKALAPLLQDPDRETQRLARDVSVLLRDVNFSEVSKLAGQPHGERDVIVKALLAEQPSSIPLLKAWGRAPAEPKTAASKATRRTGATNARPDDDYFRGYVEPILTTRGKDGYACVHCHASHTLFNATLSTAKNVIDLDNPEESLILRKPVSDAESEGTLGSKKLSHGGGIRFEKDSPEYTTILNWIKGTKP
jgi:hypothetical protein